MTKPAPVLRYPGAKWNLAPWILQHLPKHHVYVEPFFGSGAVFFHKKPTRTEYINDLDGDIVNLFRVLREDTARLVELVEFTPWAREEYIGSFDITPDPLERARRTLVRFWQAYGGTAHGRGYRSGWRHDGPQSGVGKGVTSQWANMPARIQATALRLRHAMIENLPAIELLGRLNHENVLAYIDPPYVGRTRKWKAFYREEMLDEAVHRDLLEFLLDFRGMVVLSGYATDLYDTLLSDWLRVTRMAQTEQAGVREEVLWINPAAAKRLDRRVNLFEGEA